MKINLSLLETLHGKMSGRVKYRLGAKAKLGDDSNDIEQIDCSGYVRYLVHRVTGEILPDGSQNQLGWARKNLRRLGKYGDVIHAKNDPSRVFIAFLSPAPGDEWPRHVWLLRSQDGQMKTMESCGSQGVCSRPWNTRALAKCKECFELTG